MRIERWWWLALFCFVSLVIHLLVGRMSPSLGMGEGPVASREIEIALEPLPEPKKTEPEKKPKPEPEKKPQPKPGGPKVPKPAPVKPERVAKAAPEGPKHAPQPLVKTEEPRPVAPKVNPGGEDPTKLEKPLPLGLPTAKKNSAPQPIRIAKAEPALKPEAEKTPAPASPDPETLADKLTLKTPGPRIGLDRSALSLENPLAGAATAPQEKAGFGGPAKSTPNAGGPRLARADRITPSFAGGGSPAPAATPGRDGARGPEAPPEDILFNGGGAGGTKLPKAAPRIGGGGGRNLLSVNNPLAKEVLPEDRPGLGPGTGGGGGTGVGGGVGFGQGKGIGTSPDGKYALSTLRSKPGEGIGAGEGRGIGTRSPGGGSGSGAELPGSGGRGTGYGRGTGFGIGNGKGPGFAAGAPGGGGRGGGGGGPAGIGGGGGSGRMALNRGIPFGDLSGLLTGGDERGGGGRGGGPGGPGRGALFGQKPGLGGKGGDGNGAAHIVYVLDTSGSMNQGDKIGKAKDALKKALSELKPGDSFNIITFDANVHWFATSLLAATRENLTMGIQYVDSIQLRGGTNLSGGLEKAFAHTDATHVFLLSDGEPSRGITNADQLRETVKVWNRQKAHLLTLALGLGEQFPGIPLLKGLADDNEGKFSYVNLAK